MELNAETVKKGLECCTYGGDITKSQVEVCLSCPYFNEGNCTDMLKENALALIISQERKIFDLEQVNVHAHASFVETYNEYAEK